MNVLLKGNFPYSTPPTISARAVTILLKTEKSFNKVFISLGGLQFGSTAFETRLSYGGGGGGGGGSAFPDDPNRGGKGGNGGGLVYLQLEELTLSGKILAEGDIVIKK